MTPTKISVTASDIRHTTRGRCPVANAAERILGPKVIVSHRWLWIGRSQFPLPPEATTRIQRWDKTGKMLPFTFTLDAGRR